MLTAVRQFAASWLLIVALAHVGTPALFSLWGSPIHVSAGCDGAALPAASSPMVEQSADPHPDGCCESCCFCCCAHLLPVDAIPVLPASGSASGPVLTLYFSPSQRMQPGLPPPRA